MWLELSPRKPTVSFRGGGNTREQNWEAEDPSPSKHGEQIWICMACLPSSALPWVRRASDSQPQAARAACSGRATRATLSLLRPEFALSQHKFRKTSKEAAANALNCWPVLLEQCKSRERDQRRKWRRRAADNNLVSPFHYRRPQTPPTEATLRGTKKSTNCFPLNMSQTSLAQWTTLSCTPWKITKSDYQNL